MGQVALADSDCQDVIKDCNVALKKADAVIAGQNDAINTLHGALGACRDSNKALEVNFREAEEGRNAWYRQPEIVIPASVVVGLILGIYLTK